MFLDFGKAFAKKNQIIFETDEIYFFIPAGHNRSKLQ